jgi:hypothetical protein
MCRPALVESYSIVNISLILYSDTLTLRLTYCMKRKEGLVVLQGITSDSPCKALNLFTCICSGFRKWTDSLVKNLNVCLAAQKGGNILYDCPMPLGGPCRVGPFKMLT